MNQYLKIEEADVNKKRVLMRVDFNVPLDEKGAIVDDSRIRAHLPTIRYILAKGASLVLMSHMGRPKGVDLKFSLKPCKERLEELLGFPILFSSDCIGDEAKHAALSLKKGHVLVLENIRFHKEEEEGDSAFAEQLSLLGDFYVNDAFGSSHRAHASITELPTYFKGKAAAGFLLDKELLFLQKALEQPEHPFAAIIGGAKVSSKLGVLKQFLTKVDLLFIGGGMAYTFLKATGMEIGQSIVEDSLLDEAKAILDLAKQKGVKIILPIDFRAVKEFKAGAFCKEFSLDTGIEKDYQGIDIGPKTLKLWKDALKNVKTIFWNGPVGVYEIEDFAIGTESIARFIGDLDALKVVGGGDSVAAILHLGIEKKFNHLSTGGGASLELLEKGSLPGINALIYAFSC